MRITEVNELLEKVSKGEMSAKDAEKVLGTERDEELGEVFKEEPAEEQLSSFAVILCLLVLQVMYDSLFVMGILEGWDQQFLSFVFGMALLILGIMLDVYRRSFLPDILEVKGKRFKVISKLDRRPRNKIQIKITRLENQFLLK